MDENQELVSKLEEKLRAGDLLAVAQAIKGLDASQIPRKWLVKYANICRRSNHISLGLKLLSPLFRSETLSYQISSMEKIEYGSLLQLTGATHEAITLLSEVQPTENPEALLSRAFCYFNIWDYAKALPLLKQYSALVQDPYKQLVVQLNLGAALTATFQYKESESVIRECLDVCRSQNHTRLVANCLEVLTQIYIYSQNWPQADHALSEAEQYLGNATSLDGFFVRKWRAFLDSRASGDLQPLLRFKKEVLTVKHYETIREIDLLSLKIKFSQDRFDYLYGGTPYLPYRQRVEKIFGVKSFNPDIVYGKSSSRLLVLETGNLDESSILNPGSATHKTLAGLTSDLYHPPKIGKLFNLIFPGEYFNPSSAPARVHRNLSRTRQWIIAQGLPMKVECHLGHYQLTGFKNFGILLKTDRAAENGYTLKLKQLQRASENEKGLTANQIRNLLNLSPSSAKRFIAEAKKRGDLKQFGAGSRSAYYVEEYSVSK